MVNKRGVPIGPTWLTRTLEVPSSLASLDPCRLSSARLSNQDFVPKHPFRSKTFLLIGVYQLSTFHVLLYELFKRASIQE